MNHIEQHIEALIFASEKSISLLEIKQVIQSVFEFEIFDDDIQSAINNILKKYTRQDLAIELVQISGGCQFLTKKKYHSTINQLQIQRSKKKLSQAALETLAIIAYKQPITKLEIENIRGVNCDYTVQKLLEKELISISGKADKVGRPILYGTSTVFMDYFGINTVAELPQLKDLISESNEIGQPAE